MRLHAPTLRKEDDAHPVFLRGRNDDLQEIFQTISAESVRMLERDFGQRYIIALVLIDIGYV